MDRQALSSIYLDVQRGILTNNSGSNFDLTPQEMILLYWLALEAPDERIARALEIDDTDVPLLVRALQARLGLSSSVPKIALSNGWAPSSDWPWQQRTAVTIIHKGLARLDTGPLVYTAGKGALSVGEVSDLIERICAGLHREGIGKGDWVAVDATQRLESFLVVIATILVGGVVVRLGDSVARAILRNMLLRAPVAMTFSARFEEIGALPETGKRVSFRPGQGVPEFSKWIEGCPEPLRSPDTNVKISPSDPALIGFTSGSTGEPKVILNSHEAIFRTTEVAARRFHFQSDDIFCTTTDFTALSAFRSMLTLPLFCGGRVVLPTAEARRHPVALAKLCASYAVTRLTAVPNLLRSLVKARGILHENDLSAMRTVFSGSGVLDGTTAEKFEQNFGVSVEDYYGGREIGTVAYSAFRQSGTMSFGGGGASEALIRILNEDGTPCAAGETGELCVHTDSVMLGYLGAINNGVAIKEGWCWTGDLGRVHADGRIEITGRRRDIIKSAEGGIISPVEIENILHKLNAIRESCVFGWSDGDGIERVGAAVILCKSRNRDEEKAIEIQIKTLVRDELGPFKVPTHIIFCDRFPRVARGKPNKGELRRRLQASLAKG